MKNKILTLLALLSAAFFAHGQGDWSRFDKLMGEGSYKSAYALAEGVYNKWRVESGEWGAGSREALAAAYHMAQAAAVYQEDARDSAEARYRSLLPQLAPLEKALCHAFLGEYDSALVYEGVLKATPVESIKMYCDGGKTDNMTPTAYDVVVVAMQGRGMLTPRQQVEWQRRLCDFHAGDGDELRIWHDCRLLDYLAQVPNQPMGIGIYQCNIDKYRGTKSGQVASLYAKAANHCRWQQKDLVQAVRYCDTAIARWPKSQGGVECANIRSQITAPRLQFSREQHFLYPQREELMGVDYANLERIHLRLIKEPAAYMTDEQLAKKKALREWTVDVPRPDAYGEASACFALPALPEGKYRLLAAPTANFAKGMATTELHVTDIALRYTDDGRGLVVDRETGAPVAGQQVKLLQPKQYYPKLEERLLQTVVTAADGTYRFDSLPPRNSVINIERNGYSIGTAIYNRGNTVPDGRRTQFHLVSDRPVYRPGDTVQVAVTLYRTDGRNGELLAAGHLFQLTLSDPNGQQVQQLELTTDDFGMAHCALPLPTDRLAGHWMVRVQDDTGNDMLGLRVEEYKQPRFMVSLGTENGVPAFGKPYTVQGLAAAYSGVSIGGARVQYTVTRTRHFWRWGPSLSTEVAQGEVQTAADGTFKVSFTPEPDSNIELSTKPVFSYRVRVTVTDLNGESHDAETTLRVGYRHLFVRLKEIGSDLSELPSVGVDLTDINGTPQQGRVEVTLERLRRPEPMKLAPAVLKEGMLQTIDREDYRRRFPQYIYDRKENDRRQWAAEWRWTGVATNGKVGLPPLQGGIYRIVAWTIDGQDTVADTTYTVLTPVADKVARTDEVLWADQDKATAHPGERVTFRLGSAYKEVKAFYWIEYGERQTLRTGWLALGDRLQEVAVDIDSSMLGGLTMTVVVSYKGQAFTKSLSVDVPYSHKQQKVEIATFRDKLLPGEQEEWTIRVGSGECVVDSSRGQVLPTIHYPLSTLILTMYDDALNTYGNPSWSLWPWRSHRTEGLSLHRPYLCWDRYDGRTWLNYNGTYPSVWTLKEALPYYNRWRGGIMYKTAAMRNAAVVTTSLEVVEDEATLDAVVQTSANGEIGAVEEEEAEEAIFSIVEKEPEVQLRSNLSTLAFFAPALRTDTAGTATYRFTVPELLTRWNVKGLAVTRDLKTGTLDRTLITQKPLMVQPNMPRFLRSGDSLSLMAKVVLAADAASTEAKEVDVSFLLTDAATGDTLCHHTEQVLVKDVAQVLFDVEVPRNVYVATYRIVAQTEGMSDGEQGQLPVVTNRQAVTVSQALYINGVGEKHFAMPEWQAAGDTREPLLVAAEVTGTPLWLAVKSMPYLKDCENPSTTYLADQLYVNGLGRDILDNLGNLDILDNIGGTSRLRMNEDVKQTLLQATPWVRDALAEEDQMAAVRNYFDTAALEQSRRQATKQLLERQNADGGWSWMPDGKSSLWVTQQVLKRVKNSQWEAESTERALAYVDREQQRYYDRYIKPYLKKGYKWEPTDIDYLYTRSFYGRASTEAYRFYYDNALKHYRDYGNLYTQAQLALIFHRHGAASSAGEKDSKAALDLLRRLKEKSLTSDEMGLYWRDNQGGWCWYQRPVETQALLIQAFAEITPDDRETIGLMQQWLLKQKQTTHWGNSPSTTEAISALMSLTPGPSPIGEGRVELSVFGETLSVPHAPQSTLEDYRQQRWTGTALDSLRARGSNDIVVRKADDGIAWGAVYYQFEDDMDKIPSSDMGITLKRSFSVVGSGELTVGSKVKVRIDIQCDRAMEYLELVDGRPSCVEPLSTRAGWRWNDGLSYYITVGNTDTRCYIERLEKGRYWLEYEVYVTNPGSFLSGPVTMQCMYAPEFRATAPAQTLEVQR
ncbi:MAG: hypothetical protein IJ524_04930 [Bacteroidales bacterium]|nr:hypothetical protein [Bacteroidales bacterium]